jgi:hypothetical protein
MLTFIGHVANCRGICSNFKSIQDGDLFADVIEIDAMDIEGSFGAYGIYYNHVDCEYIFPVKYDCDSGQFAVENVDTRKQSVTR